MRDHGHHNAVRLLTHVRYAHRPRWCTAVLIITLPLIVFEAVNLWRKNKS